MVDIGQVSTPAGSRCHGLRPGRRPRQPAPWSLPTNGPSPRCIFGGKTPDHRLRPVQCAQFRYQAHRRRHPVQGPFSLIRHFGRAAGIFSGRSGMKASTCCRPAQRISARASGTPGTADAVFQNIDIIGSYKPPKHVVVLAGDHIYKMDYELMLQQHVNSRRRRDHRLPRGAARWKRPVSASCTSTSRRSHHLLSSRSPKDPPATSRQARGRARLDGHLRLRDRGAPARPSPAGRGNGFRLEPRDFGKDLIPAHRRRTARPWRTNRFAASCVRSDLRGRGATGATSARSMPTGRPIST